MLKSIINFFRDHFSKQAWIAIALMAIIIAIVYRLNLDILSMTHGYYNMFDILFM